MRNAILKKVLAFALSFTLVITMAPMIPGAAAKASAESAFNITVSTEPAAGGTVALVGEPNSDGTFNYDSNVRADAESNDGYEFSGWYEDDVLVSSALMYPFAATEDRNLVAKFTKTGVFITATAENPEYGTVTGGGIYAPGEEVGLLALANDKYKFVRWTEDGTEVSTDFYYSFDAAEDRNLVAVFEDADQRTKVELVEATSDVDKLLGYNNEYAYPSFTVETGAPAYFDEDGYGRYDRGYWEKKNDDGTFSTYGENVFSEGTYRYMVQVRIDDDEGKTHRLADTPVIKVNGVTWNSWDTANIFDYYSYTMAWSPEYTITVPENELVFKNLNEFEIEEAYVGAPIDSYSVASAVSGGTAPYTFSKVDGPDWITVSEDGEVSGTPTAVGNSDELVIRVRDDSGMYRDIEIYVCKVIEDDGRTRINNVEATSNFDELAVYGGSSKRGDVSFNVTTGAPAYLLGNSSNGSWQIYKDGEWVNYREEQFFGGTYRYSCQVRVDGGNEYTHKLSKNLSVSVDGNLWAVSDVVVGSLDDTYPSSMTWVTSPTYTIEEPADAELIFLDNSDLDIRDLYVNTAITSFTVKNQVHGGTAPYTFSKVSGPDWINVSADGTISGTPTAASSYDHLVVRVTDADGESKEITIFVNDVNIRPEDRTKISTVVATSNFDTLTQYGGSSYRGDVAFTITTGAPAYFNGNSSNGSWEKFDGSEWVRYNETQFVEGQYRYTCQVRTDGNAGKTHMLTEDLTVTVDGKPWTLNHEVQVYDTYCMVWVISPTYTIEKPPVTELLFMDDSAFDIPENYTKTAITSYSVASAASGGVEPYTFSKASGPAWITVSEDGTVSGTPVTAGWNYEDLVIRVTDKEGTYKEITIDVGRTYPNPSERTVVSNITATAGIDVAMGGKVQQPTITVTEGTQARFVLSATNGKWYVKNGENWEVYTKSNFEAGTYRFECPITIDSENGKSYVLGDDLTITVDGKTWTAKAAPTTTNTSSTVDVYSAEYVVDETKFGITVKTDGNGVASASAKTATKDTEITLTVMPNTGFVFTGWETTPNTLVITDNEFVMPECAVTVKALFKPEITGQPEDATVKAGETAKFVVKTQANYKDLEWQYRTSETGEWETIYDYDGVSAVLNVVTDIAYNGYQYRCVITDTNENKVYSDIATLYVDVVAGVWKKSGTKWWYKYEDGTYPKSCWETIDGEDYYFDASGYMVVNKWVGDYYVGKSGTKAKNQWVGSYYVGEDGKYVKNQWVGNYYCGDNGKYQKGWLKLSEGWYYLGTNGKVNKGWFQVKKAWYYGDKTTGLLYEEEWLDGKYYFKSGGAMATGWLEIGSDWYYFKSGGDVTKGWAKISNKWYYFDGDYKMATGLQTIEGAKYFFNASGAMLTGWLEIEGNWYYFKSGGSAAEGWLKIGKTWYYFDDECKMVSGAGVVIDGEVHDFKDSGAWIKQVS